MPHIRALFIEDEKIMAMLRSEKGSIRKGFALHSGYNLEEIAFIPDMIPSRLSDMADNLLPLEFVIEAGTKCVGKTKAINAHLKYDFAEIIGFKTIRFGIWLRTSSENDYTEHKP